MKLRLPLRYGGEPAVIVRYELLGSGTQVLFVSGGISAGRHAFSSGNYPEPGWWESQRQTFDRSRYRLLSVDWIGADGATDLVIDPADQAKAIACLLDRLRIDRLHAFLGSSYGGMVGMQLAARHAGRVGALLAISASAAPHPFSSACRALQRRVLAFGEAVGEPAAGVSLARAMAMLTYRTPEEFSERFASGVEVTGGRVRVPAESYLEAQGGKHVRRMSAVAYRRLSESIDLHSIDAAELRVPVTLVGVDSDALVPVADVEALAAAAPDAEFRLIHSRFGHDAFLKEEAQVGAIVTDFLNSLEKRP
ncbi:MAG: homoserine O-succinyltransferase MetX [Sphingomicrobium sp.]